MQDQRPALVARNKIGSLITPIAVFTVLLGLSVLMMMSGIPKVTTAGLILLGLFSLLLAFCFMWVWADGVFQRRRALVVDHRGIWYRPGWRKATVLAWSEIDDVEVKELKADKDSLKYVAVKLRPGVVDPVFANQAGIPLDPGGRGLCRRSRLHGSRRRRGHP